MERQVPVGKSTRGRKRRDEFSELKFGYGKKKCPEIKKRVREFLKQSKA